MTSEKTLAIVSPERRQSESLPQSNAALLPKLVGNNGHNEIFVGAHGKRYKRNFVLGQGGQAIVYSGVELQSGSVVAIKVARESGDKWMANEEAVLSQVRHTNLVALLDKGVFDNLVPFIVMPLIAGCSLRQALKSSCVLPVVKSVAIALQIVAAVQCLHESGYIHRDLKPANIMVSDLDNDLTVTVLDCGIATPTTSAGQDYDMAYTPGYCAPEIEQGNAFDVRADIYQIGLILFECLFGSLPATIHAGREKPLLSYEQKKAINMLCPKLGTILGACLQADPDKRPSSMCELKDALSEILNPEREDSLNLAA